MADLPASSPSPPPPQDFWDKTITTTPVVLTLLATLLAGLSSSEMTQAQYHRSLAAQNQSKAGDQWGFFQAKRIRGTIVEKALALHPTLSGRVNLNDVRAAVDQLADRFQEAPQEADRLVKAVQGATKEPATTITSLGGAATPLAGVVKNQAEEARKLRDGLSQELGRKEVQEAFSFLSTDRLPEIQDAAWKDATLSRALDGIKAHLSESELAPAIAEVDANQLAEALQVAEGNTRAFEDAGKQADRVMQGTDHQLKKLIGLAQVFHRHAGAVEAALTDDVPAGKAGMDEVRTAAAAMARTDRALQRQGDELREYQAARDDYTARRNRREANYNEQTAGLYEVVVRKNSLESERHRVRSKNFFYGMLCAQAGTVIASLALAARKKNTLWGLAGLAGIVALVFSVYVYWFM